MNAIATYDWTLGRRGFIERRLRSFAIGDMGAPFVI
jgi:hypothetical protein